MVQVIFVVLAALGAALAGCNAQAWDSLTLTWGLNPFSKYEFMSAPRQVADAVSGGWLQRDNYCGSDTTFRGIRYFDSTSDPALTLLFDVNGYIAGIQTSIPKTAYTPSAQQVGKPFVDDGMYWTLTAYFVDPSIICTTGRTAAQFAQWGTGDRLVLMNGTYSAANMLTIPLTQTEIGSTSWTEGKCFWTMGLHYWYNVTKSMSCDIFTPYFLLYNKGVLNGWGFSVNANLPSNHYDYPHPTPTVAGQFINPEPDCFFTNPSFDPVSTMHVYFTDNPRTGNLC